MEFHTLVNSSTFNLHKPDFFFFLTEGGTSYKTKHVIKKQLSSGKILEIPMNSCMRVMFAERHVFRKEENVCL